MADGFPKIWHPRFWNAVEQCVHVFTSMPNATQEELLAELQQAGFTEPECWQLIQFVPMGFFRAVFEPQGVRFTRDYFSTSWATGARQRRPLAEEAFFCAAFHYAKVLLADGVQAADLASLYQRSAEFAACESLKGKRTSYGGIVLVTPHLWEL